MTYFVILTSILCSGFGFSQKPLEVKLNLKAGAEFMGAAKTSGTLLISIYEMVYNASNTGSYLK